MKTGMTYLVVQTLLFLGVNGLFPLICAYRICVFEVVVVNLIELKVTFMRLNDYVMRVIKMYLDIPFMLIISKSINTFNRVLTVGFKM